MHSRKKEHDRSINVALRRAWLPLALLVGVFIAAPGCAKKPRPTSYPGQVQGTVLLDDEPLSRGTVTLIPQVAEKEGGRPGIARIDSEGGFWVGNANPTKPTGVPPGKYKVTVLAMQPGADPSGPIAKLLVPDRYVEESTTPFVVEIAAGDNQLDLRLQR